jgi:hypothetical protein
LPVIKSNCEGTNWSNNIDIVQVINNSIEFKKTVLNLNKITYQKIEEISEYKKEYGNDKWIKQIEKVYVY